MDRSSARFIIQSHRGDFASAGENTLEAFERAWNLGTIPEADLRTTRDGVIVAFHDENLMRMNVADDLRQKRVADLSSDELSALAVPTLAKIFAAMRTHADRQIYLDIKSVDLRQLAGEAKRADVIAKVILTSTIYSLIEEWISLVPGGQTLLWMGGEEPVLRRRIEALRKVNFAGITQLQIHIHLNGGPLDGPDAFKLSDRFIRDLGQELKPRGILFQSLPYDTTDPRVYRRLMDLGVQSFATDHPTLALDAVRSWPGHAK